MRDWQPLTLEAVGAIRGLAVLTHISLLIVLHVTICSCVLFGHKVHILVGGIGTLRKTTVCIADDFW
jgi:hypothetical protein